MFLNFQICSKQNDRLQFGCLSDNIVVPCRKMQLDPEGEKHFASFKFFFIFYFFYFIFNFFGFIFSSAEDLIYSFKYDRNKGVWKMIRRCLGDSKPDHVTVVFDVMEAAAINLTKEELIELFRSRAPKRHH